MKYNSLGDSGLFLSRLGFGSWVTFKNQLDIPKAVQMMGLAYENGINFFDNAETYEDGLSEEIMGAALKELKWDRSSYCVSSKVFWGGAHPTQKGLSRKHVMDACHQSLKRFNLDYIDLFYCHRPDIDTPILETVRAMDALVKQGKILYWGTSEWEPWQIIEAHKVANENYLTPPTMEQPQYNMFERTRVESDYKHLIKNYGLGLTTWSPLCSGILTGKYENGIPEESRLSLEHLSWLKDHFSGREGREKIQKAARLRPLAEKLGCSMAQLSIAWCLKNDDVSTIILGASNQNQLKENIKSIEIADQIDSELNDLIEGILENRPEGPVNFKNF